AGRPMRTPTLNRRALIRLQSLPWRPVQARASGSSRHRGALFKPGHLALVVTGAPSSGACVSGPRPYRGTIQARASRLRCHEPLGPVAPPVVEVGSVVPGDGAAVDTGRRLVRAARGTPAAADLRRRPHPARTLGTGDGPPRQPRHPADLR